MDGLQTGMVRALRLGRWALLGLALTAALVPAEARAQTTPVLDENCVAFILNRVAQVNVDGSYVIPNIPVPAGLVRAREQQQLMLEIFLRAGGGRFSIDGGEFAYDHLGPRLSEDRAVNFVSLVQDIVQRAPQAGLSRGTCAACKKPPELFPYPSKQAFNEELVWMLWRIGQSATQ